jgi:hypothetical protein
MRSLSLEEQNSLDQRVGMLHFVDRLPALIVAELGKSPVRQHLGMQEILVDGCKFVLENLVQVLDDCAVALHVASPALLLLRCASYDGGVPKEKGPSGPNRNSRVFSRS